MTTMQKTIHVGVLVAVLMFVSCGEWTESDYIDYGGTTKAITSCSEGEVGFTTYIQPAIDNKCSSCHRSISSPKLVAADSAANRKVLLAYSGKSVDKLYGIVSNGFGGHPGGDQSSFLSKSNITNWLALECN